jgi:hypothetical protein
MMTKEQYVRCEVVDSYQDHKFVYQVLSDYFWSNIKELSDEEFKQYLIEHGFEIEENTDD